MIAAVYGGAFDPCHAGHGMIVSWILSTGQADMVILAPSANHPFGKKMSPFYTRVGYCQALRDDLGRDKDTFRVSFLERDLPAPNYSINLLRALQTEYPGDTLRFVMGTDNLAKRADWYGFEDIEREFDPIFVNRAGVVLPEGVEVMSPVFPDVSSTEVRRRVAAGLPVDHLVTAGVLRLMNENAVLSSSSVGSRP